MDGNRHGVAGVRSKRTSAAVRALQALPCADLKHRDAEVEGLVTSLADLLRSS